MISRVIFLCGLTTMLSGCYGEWLGEEYYFIHRSGNGGYIRVELDLDSNNTYRYYRASHPGRLFNEPGHESSSGIWKRSGRRLLLYDVDYMDTVDILFKTYRIKKDQICEKQTIFLDACLRKDE